MKLTEKELALVEETNQEYLAMQTVQEKDDLIIATLGDIWKYCGTEKPPKVTICLSPIDCKKKADADGMQNMREHWSMWYAGYDAVYGFSKKIGIEIDEEKVDLFSRWVRCCPFLIYDDDNAYVSRKPCKITFNDNNQLHNESGMACEYMDGWGVYVINGVRVDEQIVMRPETQTLEQLRNEQNEEIKRIRIERYGWAKFFDAIKAKVIDHRENDIEGTKEYLLTGDGLTALMCVCPSTGKEFFLETSPDIKTCAEAQRWLSNGLSDRIISAS